MDGTDTVGVHFSGGFIDMSGGRRVGWFSIVVVSVGLVASCGESKRSLSPLAQAGGGQASEPLAEPLAGAGGERTAAEPPAGPDPRSPLGRACDDDEGCGGEGLYCLRADRDYLSGLGAPPGGLCTADCDADDDCAGFDGGAICATLDEAPVMIKTASETARRFCMQACSLGGTSGAAKCHGRRDLACRPFATVPTTTCDKGDECPSDTFCFRGACRKAACGPRCNTDRDCMDGRACDAASGLCTAEPLDSVPLGAECPGDTDPTSTVCGQGTCLLLSDEKGRTVKRTCTQTCTLGSACGGDGACIMPRLESYAAGDIGYCVQRCDCDADCRSATDVCAGWVTDALATHFQSRGFCLDPAYGAEGTSCDGTGGAGGVGNAAGAGGTENAAGAGGALGSGGDAAPGGGAPADAGTSAASARASRG